MQNVNKIWHILNEACHGREPVYELACACVNLPEETIFQLADKIEDDIHHFGFNKKEYIKFLNKQNYKQRIMKALEVTK